MSIISFIKSLLPGSVKSLVKALLVSKSDPSKIRKIRLLVSEAQEAKENQSWEKEVALRKQILAINPNDHRSAVRLVNAQRQITGSESVIELATVYTDRFPKIAGVWRERGKNYLHTSNENALVHWKKAWELEPSHIGTGLVVLRLHLALKEVPQAIQIAEQLITLDPYNEKVIYLCSKAFIKGFQFDKADELILSGLQKYPEDDLLYNVLGDSIITNLRKCAQEQDMNGNLLPITTEHRNEFLNNPSQQFNSWNSSTTKGSIDQHRYKSRETKNSSTSNNKKKENILFVSLYNWNFMEGIVKSFGHENVNIKTLEFNDIPTNERLEAPTAIGHFIDALKNKKQVDLPIDNQKYYMQLFDWADVIYVEWCNYPAVWLSYMLPPEKKLIIRLHSYEAFTFWPHLVNWGNVDTLIHVADHIKEFLKQQIDISKFGTTIKTIYNYNDLRTYDLPKLEEAEKTIGMIGYNNANKNPLYALEILKTLKRGDSSWKLNLIGHNWPKEIKEPTEDLYRNQFMKYAADKDLLSSINFVEFTHKVPEEVQKLGYIISASDREGTHEVVIQAMGGGTIPVIRDWPMVKKWGGARIMYDECWIKDSAEEAAEFILEIDSKGKFEELSAKAKLEAFSKFDQSIVMPQLIEAIMS